MMIKNIFFTQEEYKIFAVLSIFCFVLFSTEAIANSDSNLEKQFNIAFEQMIDDPANVDITLKYANIAIEMGDYEAAIPPLERIIFFNPELNEIKLKLGIMYFNLGANDIAEQYFVDAIEGVEDREVIDRANNYLSKIRG